MNYTDSSNTARISVNAPNLEDGLVTVAIKSPTSNGKTRSLLNVSSSSFNIELEKFELNAYGARNTVDKGMVVKLFDRGGVQYIGYTDDNGYLDGYLPKKYLINMREPYTQNRIKYDVHIYPDYEYRTSLNLSDIYVPTQINLSSSNPSGKLFKFPATKTMATDAQYKGYLIYPAVQAQRNFDIADSINNSFSFVGNITLIYSGDDTKQTCSVSPSGDSYTIDKTDPGCDVLDQDILKYGDWVIVEYTIATPGLSDFISNGWGYNKNFTFPTATIDLQS